MNPRHAAALALIGWYLMMPLDLGSKHRVYPPLSQRKVEGAFGTAEQCERELAKELADLRATREEARAQDERANENRQDNIRSGTIVFSEVEFQKCVASDDPRLRK